VVIQIVKPNFVTKGEGDTILFVHGLGESLESWSKQVDFFGSQGFRAVALDLRGHGHSQTNEKIEMEGFSDDVFEVLNALSVERAHLCGLSMGALVVMDAYRRNAKSFLSMTLVSTLPQYPPAQTQALENMSMAEIGDQVASAAVGPSASVELKKNIARVVASTDKKSYIQSAETACAQDYTSMLGSIRVPTLLVAGDLDYITPPEAAMFMQKRIANSQLSVIRGVGHLPNRENPNEFNGIMLEFLMKVKQEEMG
jgi:pimeloyl-ACP methyl ester carboxylesterase